MYGELFEYCCALYRLLGAAAATACSLYSYSGGASLASDHKAFTREETLLPDVGRGHGCYEYSSISISSKHSSNDVVEHTHIFFGGMYLLETRFARKKKNYVRDEYLYCYQYSYTLLQTTIRTDGIRKHRA